MYEYLLALALCAVLALASAPTAWGLWLVHGDFGPYDNPSVTHALLAGVNEVAIAHPEVRGVTVLTESMQHYLYAYATPTTIVINNAHTATPTGIQALMDDDVRYGYHPSLGRCTGPQFIAYHESAHIIDRAHGRVARDRLLEEFGSGAAWHDVLSGYSFDEYGDFAPGEALAEAFASVLCNGGNGTERAISRLLTS